MESISTYKDALTRLQQRLQFLYNSGQGSFWEETRRCLAWVSIQKDAVALNLDRAQERQFREAVGKGDKTIELQLDAAYQWALAPKQDGTGPLKWEIVSLRGNDVGSTGGLVQRASYGLQSREPLILNWSPVHLRRELDQYLWKDGRPHLTVKQHWDYFATYPYLSRLRDRDVLLATIKAVVFTRDFFGYATGVADNGSYVGLTFGSPPSGDYYDDTRLVIRPEVAGKHIKEQEKVATGKAQRDADQDKGLTDGTAIGAAPAVKEVATRPKRF